MLIEAFPPLRQIPEFFTKFNCALAVYDISSRNWF